MADSGILLQWMLGLLNKKLVVPTDFHEQCKVVRQLLKDDMTGLVDTLTDFAVQSATVDFTIETSNENLNKIFELWASELNCDYNNVPIGLKALAQEYFKERWKGSSFPVLKIAKWDKYGSNIILPVKMLFVDGESIYCDDQSDSEDLKIEEYDYYLGKKFDAAHKIVSDKYIVQKPYCRWFDKYPTPYIIKRGVYHNWKVIESLKNKQMEILDQIIPYLLVVKKGTESLANAGKTYQQAELQEVVNQMQALMSDLSSTAAATTTTKTPIRASNFDEDLKHLIPDIGTMFKTELFEQAERNILSGLGFVDVIQGTSSTRREATLNPKAFVQEVNAGIEGFKEVLRRLLYLIKQENESHVKYVYSDFYISSAPVKTFMTPEFETAIRSLYDRGGLSKRTYTELISGLDFDTERYRRQREMVSGINELMYPQIIQNNEDKGIDLPGQPPKENVPPDKQGPEAKNYENASLNEANIEEDDEDYIYDSSLETEEGSIDTTEDEINLIRSFAPRITEKYIRLRQQDPKLFNKETFKTITISPTKGIKAIVGKKPNQKNTEVQSYLFIKQKWSVSGAKKWESQNQAQYTAIMAKLELVTAPYSKISDLPTNVRAFDVDKQRAWLKIFNNAYKFKFAQTGNAKIAETYAFRTAYSRTKDLKLNKSFIEKIKNNLFPNALQEYEFENELEESVKKEEDKERLQRTVREKQNIILDKLLKETN